MSEDLQNRLFNIFFPFAAKRLQVVKSQNTRFVHYTSAGCAVDILKNKEFWMRDPYCMNDFMEVEHGINGLNAVYSGTGVGQVFRETLNGMYDGISTDIETYFNSSSLSPRQENYVACISEHKEEEDLHGRLSMWRAYGNGAGVAIVMNAQPILYGPGNLKLQAHPVAYFNNSDFEDELNSINENIKKEIDFLKTIDKRVITIVVLNVLRSMSLSSKHPGFKEELEWRLIYSPNIEMSDHIKKEVCTVSGVPQHVYKIPLKETAGGDKTGGELPELIDRIIIGPTQFPGVMYKAFVDILKESGVVNSEQKVFMSDIPLRT